MDKILSVIVPAYNSEDYIERCLSPFVRADAETRKKLEIIIVMMAPQTGQKNG